MWVMTRHEATGPLRKAKHENTQRSRNRRPGSGGGAHEPGTPDQGGLPESLPRCEGGGAKGEARWAKGVRERPREHRYPTSTAEIRAREHARPPGAQEPSTLNPQHFLARAVSLVRNGLPLREYRMKVPPPANENERQALKLRLQAALEAEKGGYWRVDIIAGRYGWYVRAVRLRPRENVSASNGTMGLRATGGRASS